MATRFTAKLSFAFITACFEEEFFRPVWKGVQDASVALGVESVVAGVKDVDNDAQIGLVKSMIAKKVDGIALNIAHPTAFNDVIDKALAAGIPVVGFNMDSRVPSCHRLSSVSQNFFEAGKSLGNMIKPYVRTGSRILVTLHSEGIAALEERFNGIQSALEDRKLEWKTTITGTNPDDASRTISDVLRRDSEICAVLGTGQADTEGAACASDVEFKSRNLVLAGFDLSPRILDYIKKGIITLTIDQQPYIQGFYPVVQLALYCRYGIIPTDMDAGASIINRQNVDNILVASKGGYR
jgi:simple sugar transport system substrate-binding protein